MSQHVLIALGMPPDLEKFKLSHGVNERLHALLDRQDRGAGLTAAARTEAAGTVADTTRVAGRLSWAMRAGVRADMAVASGGERRQHPRLSEPFPVLVCGVDAHGEAFESNTVLENFSAGGLYVRLRWRVTPGARLFAVVRITAALDPTIAGPCVAVRGRVVRGERQLEGRWGVGVRSTHHRFL